MPSQPWTIGCTLALGCDLVVASTTARFSQIFAPRGPSLDFGVSWVPPRAVGLQQAKRLAFVADMIDAREALELGLATWVKEPHEIDAFVDALTWRLAAAAPVALTQSEALLNQAGSTTFHEAPETAARAQVIDSAMARRPRYIDTRSRTSDGPFVDRGK
ncbi:enoyl-CoA hydratase/isomerase family protein [Streptomyces sp. NPDC050145]|uniref:enoyl-CoA hydratase/isomerase family protein n=1 Tax=Streptomyces sp. NPDC050145 TaxID=3365602 RepID=UPI0037B8B0C7